MKQLLSRFTLLASVIGALFVAAPPASAQGPTLLGINPYDGFVAQFWAQNQSSSNLVQGLNANSGTNFFAYTLLPAAVQKAVVGGTNTAAYSFSTSWLSALATRTTNGTERAFLEVSMAFTNTQTSAAILSIEQNGAGGALTNSLFLSTSSTNAAVTTNTWFGIPVNPGAVVTLTSSGGGAGNGIRLVDATLTGQ